jgi:hypothetical protein
MVHFDMKILREKGARRGKCRYLLLMLINYSLPQAPI